ncbi:thymidylate kinase [Arthrobacter crusticola]|uniref:Thymidylate kinase n=1 Tax=Arthrobacter crusticola TaxID=2547960 RepID=A0A4R5U342_9MICC|nr:AAA family ATPase [Arthrobacter crusticola]TDK28013.1 thymidylate kinase [Arthrobacter crusticola]
MILVLIGIDGAGKTTAAHALAAHVPPGTDVLVLGNYSGRKTLSRWTRRFGVQPPARLMDAAETVVRLLNVLLNSVKAARFDGLVIMDRHLHCQLALRAARGLHRGALLRVVLRLLPRPDAVVLLDLPAEQAQLRIAARGTDSENLDELQAYRSAYLAQAREAGHPVIDAGRAPEAVVADLRGVLAGLRAGASPGPAGTLSPPSGAGPELPG